MLFLIFPVVSPRCFSHSIILTHNRIESTSDRLLTIYTHGIKLQLTVIQNNAVNCSLCISGKPQETHPELSSPGSFSKNFICQQLNVQARHCVTTTKLHTSGSGASIHYIIANTLTSALATRGSCFWIDWHLDSAPFFVSRQAPAQGLGIVVVLIGVTRS